MSFQRQPGATPDEQRAFLVELDLGTVGNQADYHQHTAHSMVFSAQDIVSLQVEVVNEAAIWVGLQVELGLHLDLDARAIASRDATGVSELDIGLLKVKRRPTA
jgi:hypothetical protein